MLQINALGPAANYLAEASKYIDRVTVAPIHASFEYRHATPIPGVRAALRWNSQSANRTSQRDLQYLLYRRRQMTGRSVIQSRFLVQHLDEEPLIHSWPDIPGWRANGTGRRRKIQGLCSRAVPDFNRESMTPRIVHIPPSGGGRKAKVLKEARGRII
jgi:hypothetical protein